MKINNENTQLTFNKMCRLYLRAFRYVTIYSFEGRDFSFVGTQLLTCYLLCSSVLHWSMMTVYCFNSSNVQIEDLCMAALATGGVIRYHATMLKRKTFASLINECRDLWDFCTQQGRRTVLSYERKLRRVYTIFAASCIFCNVLFPIDAIITRLPPLEPNGTERRTLPYKWFHDNTENCWPGYWPIFVLQVFLVQNAIICGMSCDVSIPLLVMICSGYFRHLRDRLSDYHKDANRRERELMDCIDFHQRLLAFCSRLVKFSQTLILMSVLSTGYSISLILIKLTSADSDKSKYVTIMGIYLCQLYLVQWAPDFLIDESEGVANAAYFAYAESLDDIILSKRLLTMVMRAQRPVQFLAGGFIPSSLETFGAMMKNAFSFFTVLRNLEW